MIERIKENLIKILQKIFRKGKPDNGITIGLSGTIAISLFIIMMVATYFATGILMVRGLYNYIQSCTNDSQKRCETIADVIDPNVIEIYLRYGVDETNFNRSIEKLKKSLGTDISHTAIHVYVPQDEGLFIIYGLHHGSGELYEFGTVIPYDSYDDQMLADFHAGKCSEKPSFAIHNGASVYSSWAPVLNDDDEPIAIVEFNSNVDGMIDEYFDNMGHPFRNTAIVFLIILIVLMMILNKFVTKPIGELTEYVQSYSMDGFTKVKPKFKYNDEIKYLADSFDMMDTKIKEYVALSTENAAKDAMINAELSIARGIQYAMLNTDFPDRDDFCLAALMNPAAYVGGDFYDYFYIDDDHIAMVVADVSGGNISGAMFMMRSMTNIKNWTLRYPDDPAKVLEMVNNELCTHNSESMFVTAWVGVLEISTGRVICSNAGHEYPVIRRANEDFEIFEDVHGFVLGGIEDLTYTNYELKLNDKDILFTYSDGVPECLNEAEEQFTMDRMVAKLNSIKNDNVDDICEELMEELRTFMGNRAQYDDITMLCLRYHDKDKK